MTNHTKTMTKGRFGEELGLAVVDVETTGFGRQDRIVEIAIVCLDSDGIIVDEFSTLVDPQRDVGAVDVHGITPEMIGGAPTFREIAHAVAERLDGRVFASHNARFASRFVDKELRRVGLELSLGRTLSTLRMTGSRLNLACTSLGIELDADHRALDAARATAALINAHERPVAPLVPAAVYGNVAAESVRLAWRPPSCATPRSDLQQMIASVRYPVEGALALAYLDALDWALTAQSIDALEPERLQQLALDLGLSATEQADAHDHYLDAVIAAAETDGSISRRGHELLAKIALCLGKPWPQLAPSPAFAGEAA